MSTALTRGWSHQDFWGMLPLRLHRLCLKRRTSALTAPFPRWLRRTTLLATGLLLLVPSLSAQPSQLRPWTNYQVILWMGDTVWKKPDRLPLFFERLREMGVTTGMVYGDADPRPLLTNQFPYYVENIINRGLCLKWNSKVRDWDKFITDWKNTGRRDTAFVRDYCLDDPQWRAWACDTMRQTARKHAAHNPLAYDIRDELSVTISANPFDYDFNPVALASFRSWLKTQYADLAALNAQWQTQFASWEAVRPFSTDQIKNRMGSGDAQPRGNPDWQQVQRLQFNPLAARKEPTRWNLSPWCDFRTYMDLSLAGALDAMRQASHAADPRTPVGIEGTQMPHAFGGYDLWRLARALDWVEPYDIACSREILGSFMPDKPLLCTLFEKTTPQAMRRLWHLLLLGDKGCIVWWSEDCLDWKSPDYALNAKAKALLPVLREMTSPLAHLFLRAKRETDPILLHYNQPSIQVGWLVESTVDGSTWQRRFSSFESDYNRQAKVRTAWLKAFQDLGYSPKFASAEEIENGLLQQSDAQVLILPNAFALSDKEAHAIQSFLAPNGNASPRAVFCDGAPGLFDVHGRLRARGALEEHFSPALSQTASYVALSGQAVSALKAGDVARYATDRLQSTPTTDWPAWIEQHCRQVPRFVTLTNRSGGSAPRVMIHRFRSGTGRLLAFERNINYHMSEDLKQAGGNEALEKPADLEAVLAQPAHVYDLRARKYLGRTDRFTFLLDPWQPSLFALLPAPAPQETLVDTLLNTREP